MKTPKNTEAAETKQTTSDPAVAQERHVCYECGKRRAITHTAQTWSGPCHICRRPILCDRILADLQQSLPNVKPMRGENETNLK